jgi:hypothetical protein
MSRRSRHQQIAIREAEQLRAASRRLRFRVTTVNWVAGTRRGATSAHHVPRTVYDWTLPHLLRRIRDMAELSEEIVSIEPLAG